MSTTSPTLADDLLPAVHNAINKMKISSGETAAISADITALSAWLGEHGSSIDDLLGHWFTDRGGKLRKRANHTAKKVDDYDLAEVIAAGFAMLSWHTSGGSIDSLMIARFRVGATRYNELESFTTLLALVLYGRSPAADRWDRALGRS